jgi:hypothetical protein
MNKILLTVGFLLLLSCSDSKTTRPEPETLDISDHPQATLQLEVAEIDQLVQGEALVLQNQGVENTLQLLQVLDDASPVIALSEGTTTTYFRPLETETLARRANLDLFLQGVWQAFAQLRGGVYFELVIDPENNVQMTLQSTEAGIQVDVRVQGTPTAAQVETLKVEFKNWQNSQSSSSVEIIPVSSEAVIPTSSSIWLESSSSQPVVYSSSSELGTSSSQPVDYSSSSELLSSSSQVLSSSEPVLSSSQAIPTSSSSVIVASSSSSAPLSSSIAPSSSSVTSSDEACMLGTSYALSYFENRQTFGAGLADLQSGIDCNAGEIYPQNQLQVTSPVFTISLQCETPNCYSGIVEIAPKPNTQGDVCTAYLTDGVYFETKINGVLLNPPGNASADFHNCIVQTFNP